MTNNHALFYFDRIFVLFFLYNIIMKENKYLSKYLLIEGEIIMIIRIEMENKEVRSYAELGEEMGMMESCEVVNQVSKNMSIKSKNFAMSNVRDEENEKVISEMEINADFLIKIIRKMSPIISACKMVYGLVMNLFDDITEDMGNFDDWDIDIESEDDDAENGCGYTEASVCDNEQTSVGDDTISQ